MTYSVHFDQHLTIGDVPLSTPAWEVLNLQVLMSGPATRGENRILPGAFGVRPLRHRQTERTVTLELAVFGDVTPAGDPIEDPQAGVWANWLVLRGQFNALLQNEGDSTTLAVLIYRGGTIQGLVQVLAYEIGEAINASTMAATLDLNLIAGMLS